MVWVRIQPGNQPERSKVVPHPTGRRTLVHRRRLRLNLPEDHGQLVIGSVHQVPFLPLPPTEQYKESALARRP